MAMFQYPIRYKILHVVCTSTWLLAPLYNTFTTIVQWMIQEPNGIQSFILQDNLGMLGMEQFCWSLYILKILGITFFPTHLQCYDEINNWVLKKFFPVQMVNIASFLLVN